MDEMTAFDQQVAREVLHEAGPPEPVDGAAILAATTTRARARRTWPLPGLTHLAAAATMILLFGSILLLGALLTQPTEDEQPAVEATATVSATTEPRPTITPAPTAVPVLETPLLESIRGLDTRSVAPGIVRVIGDGTGRDLDDLDWLHIGHDGSVWAGRDKRIFRLGEPGRSSPLPRTFNRYTFSLSDEGNLRAHHRQDGTVELQGREWEDVPEPEPPEHPDANSSVRLRATDGSWWFGSDDLTPAETLRHSADRGWEVLPLADAQTTAAQLLETPDGTLWAIDHGGPGGSDSALFHFVDERWQRLSIPGDGSVFWPESMRLDERRALVVTGTLFDGDDPVLVSALLEGGDWVVAPYLNLEVASFGDLGTEFPMLSKADLRPLGSDGIGWAIEEDGRYAIWFDGETTTRVDVPFRRRAITPAIARWAVGPDDSLWVTVQSDHPSGDSLVGDGLFVLSPDAASATDQ